MTISIEGFYLEESETYQEYIDLRSDIFVEEFGFNKHDEFDGNDRTATHYLVKYNNIPVGVARWTESRDLIKIDRFGIVKKFRGWGLGILLLKYIKRELTASKKNIVIYSFDKSVVFFIQQGFKDNKTHEVIGGKTIYILHL
jgi:predicted GNAT family N-acyltransferase